MFCIVRGYIHIYHSYTVYCINTLIIIDYMKHTAGVYLRFEKSFAWKMSFMDSLQNSIPYSKTLTQKIHLCLHALK